MLGWYAHLWISSQESLDIAIAEADRLDFGWRLDQLLKAEPKVPDQRNSARRIFAAAALLPSGWPDPLSEGIDHQDLHSKTPLPAQVAEALAADLERASRSLQEVRRLADCPDASHAVNWNGRFQMLVIGPSHSVIQLLGFDVLLRLNQGDVGGAFRSCQAMVNGERSVGNAAADPSEFRQRSNMRGRIAQRIERVLAQGVASAGVLAEFQQSIEADLRDSLTLLEARSQRAHNDYYLKSIGSGRDTVLPYVRSGPPFFGDTFAGSLARQRATCLQYNNELVEMMKLPDHIQFSRLGTLPPNPAGFPFMVWFTKSVSTLTHWQSLAELRCALVALAVERYRLAHGRWPESLNEVAPALLREVPPDPFDGKPLRYRRLPDGVVIYAVGFDGKDNGGNVDRKRPAYPAGPGLDLGIRLWDVAHRRPH